MQGTEMRSYADLLKKKLVLQKHIIPSKNIRLCYNCVYNKNELSILRVIYWLNCFFRPVLTYKIIRSLYSSVKCKKTDDSSNKLKAPYHKKAMKFNSIYGGCYRVEKTSEINFSTYLSVQRSKSY